MNVEEFHQLLLETHPKRVAVHGYVDGFEMDAPPHTIVKPGSQWKDDKPNERPIILAKVRFEEGRTESFHTDIRGTSIEYHRMGGGILYVPIELISVSDFIPSSR